MNGRVISVSQQKGGSGKTTLAVHLAVALARKGDYPVALVDVDPQGSLGTWFEAREEAFGEAGTGLSFRTSSGWGARREARDLVIIPVQPTQIDLWATAQTVEIARREGTDALLVLNRVPPRAALTLDVISEIESHGYPIAAARLGNRTGFAASMGEGRTVLETDPRGKGAEEVRQLAAEIAAVLAGI
jgi:chromosome partitioning protein